MENVIWGTGYYASLFSLKIGRENVSYYIDRDKKKIGKFLGKVVVTPDAVTNWSDICVYVPYNYYEEISSYLMRKGLVEGETFFRYDEYVYLTKACVEKDFERACREVDELNAVDFINTTVWCDRFWATKNEYRNCLLTLNKGTDSFIVLSDTPWYKRAEVEKETGCCAVVMPAIMHDYVFVEKGTINDDYKNNLMDYSTLNLAKNIGARCKGVSLSESAYKARLCSAFMEYLFTRYRFKTFIIGDSDRALCKLIRDKCRKYDIPALFTHQGIIPGTITMGPGGDVGDSIPSVYYEDFIHLPVKNQWLYEARRVWDYLRESRLNRKVQPCNDVVEKIKSKICHDNHVVLYLGQNDLDSSMIPYTDESRKYQSPIFESSMGALMCLAKICEINKWNLIYKPHPMYAEYENYKLLPDNVILAKFGDINEIIDVSDVVVTVRSSSNYISLIRYKPVLMLGYTQTRGQGCTYEAFSKNEVEEKLKIALEEGFSLEQKNAFIKHLARLLHYYLYDDMSDRPIRYGLNWPENISEFFNLERKLIDMRNKR